jgi:biotin transporter BioY
MATGVCWLSFQLGLPKAIEVGFLPFIFPGLIKAGILSLILRGVGYFKK